MRRFAAPLAIVALAAAACGSSTGSAHGSGAAARALQAATNAMRSASGYRFGATVDAGTRVADVRGEFQAPDRVHQTVSLAGRPAVEMAFLGARVLVKDPVTGRWRDRVQTAATTTDPRRAFDALGRAAAVKVRGDLISFTLPRDAATALIPSLAAGASAVDGTARLAAGRITEASYRANTTGRGSAARAPYTDTGNAPPVAEPSTA